MAGTKTYVAKPGELTKTWFLVDAEAKVVGRLVVVVNAEKVKFTGNKWEQKKYTRYTGYPGLRVETAAVRLERKPEMILREAVRRMLPKNKLGRKMLDKLKIYTGPDHEHQAQQPEPREMGAK